MPSPHFSVIMPVYNHAHYLERAVQSVIAQTCDDWELIIVDDGSTDGSGGLVDRLAARDGRIRVLHQANAGPAAARNAGLAVARGPWLAYLDSDDLYLPDTLEHYRRFIQTHPDVRFIHGYRHRIDADGAVTPLHGEYQDRPTGARELFMRMYLSHLCVCYLRELTDRCGPYDVRLRLCEDYELYLRMSLHCQFVPLGRPTGLRRRHGGNISTQTGYSRLVEAMVLRRFVERLGGAALLEPAVIAARLGKLYYAASRQYFKAGCFAQARQGAQESLSWQPTAKARLIAGASAALAPLGRTDPRPLPSLEGPAPYSTTVDRSAGK